MHQDCLDNYSVARNGISIAQWNPITYKTSLASEQRRCSFPPLWFLWPLWLSCLLYLLQKQLFVCISIVINHSRSYSSKYRSYVEECFSDGQINGQNNQLTVRQTLIYWYREARTHKVGAIQINFNLLRALSYKHRFWKQKRNKANRHKSRAPSLQRQTDRQTDRPTDRPTDGQSGL